MRKEALTLGRVGILLPILAIIPFLGFIATLAAAILLLLSFHKFSKVFQKPVIFNGVLTAFLVQIGAYILGAIIIGVVLGLSAASGSGLESFRSGNFQEFYKLLLDSTLAIIGLVIIFAGIIIAAYFMFQALKVLAQESGVPQFKLAGTLYLIGAITSIILVGIFIAFVGWIIHIVALFTMKEHEEQGVGQEEPPEIPSNE